MQEHHLSAVRNIHKRLEHLESIWDACLNKNYNGSNKEVHNLTAHAEDKPVIDLMEHADDIRVIDLTEHAGSTDLTNDDIEVIDLTEEEPMVNSHAREFSWGN